MRFLLLLLFVLVLLVQCTGNPDVNCFSERPRPTGPSVAALNQDSTNVVCPDANGPGARPSTGNRTTTTGAVVEHRQ